MTIVGEAGRIEVAIPFNAPPDRPTNYDRHRRGPVRRRRTDGRIPFAPALPEYPAASVRGLLRLSHGERSWRAALFYFLRPRGHGPGGFARRAFLRRMEADRHVEGRADELQHMREVFVREAARGDGSSVRTRVASSEPFDPGLGEACLREVMSDRGVVEAEGSGPRPSARPSLARLRPSHPKVTVGSASIGDAVSEASVVRS